MIGYDHSIRDVETMLKQKRKAIIFPHIYKTAGTTIEYAFRAEFGDRAFPCHNVPQRQHIADLVNSGYFAHEDTYIIYGHQTAGIAAILIDVIPIFHFTFLRDPIKRAESLYSYARARRGIEQSAREFIDEWPPNDIARHIGADTASDAFDILEASYFLVGLVEKFNLHFALLGKLLQMSGANYQSRNVMRSEDKVTFPPELVEYFIQRNSEDCALYGEIIKIMSIAENDTAQYTSPLDLTLADSSYVKPTPLIFDLSKNKDHISLFLTGKRVWTSDRDRAMSFFEKSIDIDPAMSLEIIAFMHRSDVDRASKLRADLLSKWSACPDVAMQYIVQGLG